jgi:hypothetical protein
MVAVEVNGVTVNPEITGGGGYGVTVAGELPDAGEVVLLPNESTDVTR